jgi:hypothetical protein
MVYSKAKLKKNGEEHLLDSDHTKLEMYQTDVYLHKPYYRFSLNTFYLYLLRLSFNTLILGYKIHWLHVSVTSTIFRTF